jgi:hypothetical protein
MCSKLLSEFHAGPFQDTLPNPLEKVFILAESLPI